MSKSFNFIQAWKYLLEGQTIIRTSGVQLLYRIYNNELQSKSTTGEWTTISSMFLGGSYEIYIEGKDFTWALEQLKAGKAVTRKAWVTGARISPENKDPHAAITIQSIMADDWILYTEPKNISYAFY